MRLNSSLDSLEPELHAQQEEAVKRQDEELPDSPETSDESMNSEAEIFIVEEPATLEGSVTISKVAKYLEEAQKKDSNSYFNTPPGPLRRISFLPISLPNDVERERNYAGPSAPNVHVPQSPLLPCQPGRGFPPTRRALSQPSPGLGCSGRRIAIGTGHNSSLRLPRWFFNY